MARDEQGKRTADWAQGRVLAFNHAEDQIGDEAGQKGKHGGTQHEAKDRDNQKENKNGAFKIHYNLLIYR